MNSHTQIGPIHIFRGTAQMVIPDRLEGISHVRGTEIRLPIQFASCPSVDTTVYRSDSGFPVPATCPDSIKHEAYTSQTSVGPTVTIGSLDIQNLGTETQIMIYAVNPDRSPLPCTYFCDYIVVGDV